MWIQNWLSCCSFFLQRTNMFMAARMHMKRVAKKSFTQHGWRFSLLLALHHLKWLYFFCCNLCQLMFNVYVVLVCDVCILIM